jgi:hypothetical protein
VDAPLTCPGLDVQALEEDAWIPRDEVEAYFLAGVLLILGIHVIALAGA